MPQDSLARDANTARSLRQKPAKTKHKEVKRKKRLAVELLTLFFMIGLPVITLIVSEFIVRDALTLSFSDWTSQFTQRFGLNILLMLSTFGLLYILPRRFYMMTSVLLSSLLIFFAVANKMKLVLRNSPITVGDFALINELQGLDGAVEINKLLVIGCITGLAALVAGIFLLPRIKEQWLIKSAVFLGSLVFLVIVWTDKPFSPMDKAEFQNTWWRQELGTMQNGLFGNFALLAKNYQIEPPKGYSRETIQSIGEKYKPAAAAADGKKPNVIFLMSEAFTDPLHFGKEHFTEDPIPNFHKLYGESLHGTMYSPEFGGGTANVEFEAVTGLSRQFLPDNTIAYQQYIKKPLPSAAYSFREAGYHATALHPFYGWYYQRQSVYKMLGFQQFITGEFMDLDYENGSGHGYPKDRVMTDTILAQLDRTDEPDFIHAVSVEAHQPYRPIADSKFLKKGTIPDVTRGYLNSYTEYMHSVDIQLGRMIDELKKRDEQTIVVFWGDHYPTFGNNAAVYGAQGTGIANNMLGNFNDFLNTHSVPYFIWQSEGNAPAALNLSPNQFGAIAMDMAGVKGNTVTAMLDEMRQKGRAAIPYLKYQKQMGGVSQEMNDLKMLQYDLLHGKRYADAEIKGLKDSPDNDYFLGIIDKMTFKKVTIDSDAYEISVYGAPKFAKLIDSGGDIVPSEWTGNKNDISTFKIKKSDIKAKEKYRLAVFDSNGNILRKTKERQFKH
ncbi:LTA synthase family protein [Peribacillus sp. SCS-37]|uniref:LTA synthase family protein n=1 Tax=Paraperibacillus esterisolvens TaxID=3115296 RepID=UPI0039065CE2